MIKRIVDMFDFLPKSKAPINSLTAMKEIIPGVDLPLSFLTNGFGYDVEGSVTSVDKLPFYRTTSGACVIRWKLSWRERIMLALSGNIWHSVPLTEGSLQPIRLHARCPLTVDDINGQKSVTGTEAKVFMSASGMLEEAFQDHGMDREAEVVTIARIDGRYFVKGHPEYGAFTTQNEAIAAAGSRIRHEQLAKRLKYKKR